MKMKNEKGVTLLSLVIAVIVLSIISGISVTTGVGSIRSAKYTELQTELKVMQAKINEIGDIYEEENKTLGTDIGTNEQEILNTTEVEEQLKKKAGNDTTKLEAIKNGFRLCTQDYIKQELGIENVKRDYIVNLSERIVVADKKYSYQDVDYYMLEQIIEFDSNLLNELDEQKQNIEVKKAEQEKKKTDLRVAKAKQGQMQILMENQKTLQVSYASKLSEEEKNLYEQIEQYKKEQEDLENQIQAAINWSGALAIQYKGGVMLWPIAVDGTYITSPYGNRLHPIQGVYRYHDGIDIGNAGFGAPVVAAADGIVTYAGVMSGYGNCVMINHGDGIVTLYGHGQEIYTELGATVKQGDVIMAVGSTGNSTGPHLHFEVRKFGVAVDPIPYLQGDNANNNTIENENVNNNQTINDT